MHVVSKKGLKKRFTFHSL